LKISGLLALCTPPKKDLLLVLAWQVLTVVCSSSDPAGSVASSKVWLLPLAVAEWGTSSLAWLTWRNLCRTVQAWLYRPNPRTFRAFLKTAALITSIFGSLYLCNKTSYKNKVKLKNTYFICPISDF
jgi:hypothetical protein